LWSGAWRPTATRNAVEPGVALDQAGIAVFRDITVLVPAGQMNALIRSNAKTGCLLPQPYLASSNFKGHNLMNQGTKRSILRWIHIVFGIPIIGYIYSPFEEIPQYAPAVRFVFLPLLLLSGFWMWKGHAIRRLISKRSAQQDVAVKP
jgi:hypothetical protein